MGLPGLIVALALLAYLHKKTTSHSPSKPPQSHHRSDSHLYKNPVCFSVTELLNSALPALVSETCSSLGDGVQFKRSTPVPSPPALLSHFSPSPCYVPSVFERCQFIKKRRARKQQGRKQRQRAAPPARLPQPKAAATATSR